MKDDQALLEAVERLVPHVDGETPDWEDVVRRARFAAGSVEGSRRRPRWKGVRRRGLVLALAAVIAVLAAAPALGLHSAILDLLGRTDVQYEAAPSAPTVMKREFAEMASGAPPGMDPRVSAGDARLAGTVDGRNVWVAPTADDEFCYLVDGIAGGCVKERSQAVSLDARFVSPAPSFAAATVVSGKVYVSDAARLEVILENGRRRALRFVYVSAPIEAGFFAYTPTAAERRPGARPVEVVVRNSDGTPIATSRIDWSEEERKAEEFRKRIEERQQQGG